MYFILIIVNMKVEHIQIYITPVMWRTYQSNGAEKDPSAQGKIMKMNTFIRISIVTLFVQILTWVMAWGCLNPSVIKTDWFGVQVVVEHGYVVFGVAATIGLLSSIVIIGAAILRDD